MLDSTKLERLLITNWASFIDPRKLFEQLNAYISQAFRKTVRVTQVKLSRFEPSKDGFVVWAEYDSNHSSGTVEFVLSVDGSMQNVRVT